MPDSPGRAVRISAAGFTSDALIPKACRSWGVATYTCPHEERPAGACWSEALAWSSSVTVFESRALAMFWATAAWACGVLAVPAGLDPPGPGPGPGPGPFPPLGVYTMIWFEAMFGPA